MNSDEANKCILDLKQGRVAAKATIAKFVAGGMRPDDAREEVFFALGGGRVTVVDESGKRWYQHSGKSVEEVRRLMEQ